MKIEKQIIIDAVESSPSMAAAALKTGLHYNTFISYAKKLGIYKPNMGGKGVKKLRTEGNGRLYLADILMGKHPSYGSFKLKNRLFAEGIKTNQCEICNISHWMGKVLMCELDHIDGNSRNHRLENLRILCANCHSQTETFRSRNIVFQRKMKSLAHEELCT